MKCIYRPKGVCSREMTFTMENGLIKDMHIEGGCNGNLQGISQLIKDMPAETVVLRLKGLICGDKGTSCPDQLAIALESALKAGST